MRRVLVTGMSGTGKSSALRELGRLGYDVVDTDERGWTVPNEADGGYLWVEDRLEELLARERATTLYVSGAVSATCSHELDATRPLAQVVADLVAIGRG